ncbi:MAG: DUF4124 domain-containing protein [Burkholderiales bacterium]
MIRFLIPLLLACVPCAACAGVYKWIDPAGRVVYGDTPPESVQVSVPDMRLPSGVDMPGCGAAGCPPPVPVRAPERSGSAQETAGARGMPFEVYIRLRRGMSEGELLLRAGAPDLEVGEGLDSTSLLLVPRPGAIHPQYGRKRPKRMVAHGQSVRLVKTYYYFPTFPDPWTTAVTLVGGRVANIDRQKNFR